jgi:hypothetical protein
MFEFPKLDNCATFPIPEGTNLEFKVGFNSCSSDKIIATICGILNIGGGYLVIGVEDVFRKIVGIKTDKSMDNFLLMIDSIYHLNLIKKSDGTSVPLGTVKTGIVKAINNKELLVVTIAAKEGEKYTLKDGTVWYRLAASNYRQSVIPTIYTEKELENIIEKKLNEQQIQFEIEKKDIIRNFQSERDKIKSKFKKLESDFECIIGAAKNNEKTHNEFRTMIYNNILLQKTTAETEIIKNSLKPWFKSWISYLCCF